MKLTLKIQNLLSLLIIPLLLYTPVYSQEYDFILNNNTTVTYSTGSDYVNVTLQLVREVKDKTYYFSTQGAYSFHISDLLIQDNELIKEEREFKEKSIIVTNDKGKEIPFSIEELKYGEGIYVKVPNYRDTTFTQPYIVNVQFTTHDYVNRIYDWVEIGYPALHEDIKFEQIHDESKAKAKVNYNLDIEVDNSISELAKVFPSKYSVKPDIEKTTYSFDAKERVGKSISLEFGTEQFYKFELQLKTEKTDNMISERYSEVINALSTNIYELALPREFSENNQRITIEKITPSPTKLITDEEGNVIATFEVPANKESQIYVSGYIQVTQNSLKDRLEIPSPTLDEYFNTVNSDINLSKYLLPTKYWEVNDPLIKQEAEKLLLGKTNLLDLIRADYKYINDSLEYDYNKADDPNSLRIGAKASLQGGPSVCMEYSDSMIAILRAQGIPSRAAFGYTNIDMNIVKKVSHQWLQIWIPQYGWLSVDPSLENENMAIGQDVKYFLWNTLADDNTLDIKRISADEFKFDDSGYSVKVYAVDKKDIPQGLLTYPDIQTESSETKDTINLLIKTTTLGKALIIVLPILVVLILLVLLISLILLLIKRTKSRKVSQV